jgi:hypothetical protein
MKNEILLEVWRNRDKFSKECNYNIDLMVEKLKRMERGFKNPLVDRTKKMSNRRVHRPIRPRPS